MAPSLRRLAGFEALIDCGLFHSRYVLAAAIVLLQQRDEVPFERGGGALALAALAAASIALCSGRNGCGQGREGQELVGNNSGGLEAGGSGGG